MIIIVDYDFSSYVIFDQLLKITFRKSSGPPFYQLSLPHPTTKNSKSATRPFANTEIFNSEAS